MNIIVAVYSNKNLLIFTNAFIHSSLNQNKYITIKNQCDISLKSTFCGNGKKNWKDTFQTAGGFGPQ